jgi:hypothetical protein
VEPRAEQVPAVVVDKVGKTWGQILLFQKYFGVILRF